MKLTSTSFKLLLLVFVTFNVVNSEIFSCMVQLKLAVEFARHNNITAYLNGYIQQQRQILNVLKELIGEFEEINPISQATEVHLEHPLGAFRFAQSAQIELSDANKATLADLNGTSATFEKQRVFDVMRRLPTINDAHGSGDGILAIQEVHKFKTNDVASGNLGAYKSRGLSYAERFTIARTVPGARLWVQNEDEYANMRAIEWLEATLDLAQNKRQAKELEPYLQEAFKNIQCVCSFQYLKVVNRLKALNDDIEIHDNCTSLMPFPCGRMKNSAVKVPSQVNFEALCRGDDDVIPLYDAGRKTPEEKLRCRYSHYNDPRLLLDPVKEEELNLINPRISILHDILTESHVQYFKKTASPNLRRGPVTSKEGQKRTYHKISQQYVVPNTSVNPVTKNMVGRLSAVSKLNLKGFEDMMVVNYGSGGVYGVHLDVLTRESHANYSRGMFNRLTTIVTYLNDVKCGGETVFTDIGIKVKPEKYAAVMFFNLYRNGDTNDLSRHSSCPVVYGEKWIANQWIRNWEQEFDYRCSVDQFE